MHRTGFLPSGRFGNYVIYRCVDPAGTAGQFRARLDQLALASPVRRIFRRQRRRLTAALRQQAERRLVNGAGR